MAEADETGPRTDVGVLEQATDARLALELLQVCERERQSRNASDTDTHTARVATVCLYSYTTNLYACIYDIRVRVHEK